MELGQLSDEQYAEIIGDEVDPWGVADQPEFEWRRKAYHVAVRDDGRLIAAAGLAVADVQFGSGPVIPVVGIGGVIVAERYRGQGFGRDVISRAVTRAEGLGPALAMLFCLPDRAPMYRRHGFEAIPGLVLADQPGGLVEMPPVAMWRPLKDGAELPDGDARILGLPF